MKLDEVAGSQVKCGLIMPAGGEESIDHGDWHGSTEVYTNKSAFLRAIKEHFVDYLRTYHDDDDRTVFANDEGGELTPELSAKIKKAKDLNELEDIQEFEGFLSGYWIDDRF